MECEGINQENQLPLFPNLEDIMKDSVIDDWIAAADQEKMKSSIYDIENINYHEKQNIDFDDLYDLNTPDKILSAISARSGGKSANSLRCKSAPALPLGENTTYHFNNKQNTSNSATAPVDGQEATMSSYGGSYLAFSSSQPSDFSQELIDDDFKSVFEDKENKSNLDIASPNKVLSKDVSVLERKDSPLGMPQLEPQEYIEEYEDCELESDNDSFILDEFPTKRDVFRPLSSSSIALASSNVLGDSKSTKFVNAFEEVDEKLHPRLARDCDLGITDPAKYRYQKNMNCLSIPKDGNVSFSIGNKSRVGYIKYIYTRSTKDEGSKDILCRFCSHRKWVTIDNFENHLAFAHGILKVGKRIVLIPLPLGFYEIVSKRRIDTFVKCPSCEKWIKLGCRESDIFRNNKHPEGLYHNYFSHYMKCDKNNQRQKAA